MLQNISFAICKETIYATRAATGVFGKHIQMQHLVASVAPKTPTKLFKCSDCEYTNVINDYVLNHMKTVHKLKTADNEENSKETFENEFVTPANSRSGDEIVVPPKRNSNRKMIKMSKYDLKGVPKNILDMSVAGANRNSDRK